MKKLLIAIIFFGIHTTTNAGIFEVDVKYDGKYNRINQHFDLKKKKFKLECSGDCDGMVSKYINAKPGELQKELDKALISKKSGYNDTSIVRGLRYEEMDKFVSETGEIFYLSEIILQLEKQLLELQKKGIKDKIDGEIAPDITYFVEVNEKGYNILVITDD